MRFPGDVLCHFDCGIGVDDRAELEVVGQRGDAVPRRPVALARRR